MVKQIYIKTVGEDNSFMDRYKQTEGLVIYIQICTYIPILVLFFDIYIF